MRWFFPTDQQLWLSPFINVVNFFLRSGLSLPEEEISYCYGCYVFLNTCTYSLPNNNQNVLLSSTTTHTSDFVILNVKNATYGTTSIFQLTYSPTIWGDSFFFIAEVDDPLREQRQTQWRRYNNN